MQESIVSQDPEPVGQVSPVPSEVIELPAAFLAFIGGGDVGSGLIRMPR